jgi:hypothetical protein
MERAPATLPEDVEALQALVTAYSTEVCRSFQTMADQSFHVKAATWTSAKLPVVGA